MLGLRHRSHGRAAGREEEAEAFANVLYAFGRNGAIKGGKVGGAYYNEDFFCFPQPVPAVTSIEAIANASSTMILIDTQARVYTTVNGEPGVAGVGDPNVNILGPTRVTGGVPVYKEEHLKIKTENWTQPEGPMGPTLPLKGEPGHPVAGAVGASHALLLLSDGTALSWGSMRYGGLGNGWITDAAGPTTRAIAQRSEGIYPQFAPFPVLTGPGPGLRYPGGQQEVAPGETNVLKGIVAISAGIGFSLFLLSNGEIYYCGGPAGKTSFQSPYAIPDPVFVPDPKNKAIAIAASRGAYLVLLENGEVRFVGNNSEFTAGNGSEKSKSTAVREMLTPSTSLGVPAKGVTAIAKAEYSCKFIKTGGTVWTCGSNAELQQGLGKPESEPEPYVTEIKSLHEGANTGRKAIAISAQGEERGTGRNGADMQGVLLDDHTLRYWGWNWSPATSGKPRWEGIGNLGTANTENASTPVEPYGMTNIQQFTAGCVVSLALKEPGALSSPTLSANCPGKGKAHVSWTPITGSPIPVWRAETQWRVKLSGTKGTPTAGLHYDSGPLGAAETEYTFTGVAAGEFKVTVNSTPDSEVFEKTTITGGKVKTASGKHLTVKWTPEGVRSEPSWIIEWRRVETFEAKGAKLKKALVVGKAITALTTSKISEPAEWGAKVSLEEEGHRQSFTIKPTAGEVAKYEKEHEEWENGELEKGGEVVTEEPQEAVPEGATLIPIEEAIPTFAFQINAKVIIDIKEKWNRAPTDAPGEAGEYALTLVENTLHELKGEEVEVVVRGSYEGAFKKRATFVTVE